MEEWKEYKLGDVAIPVRDRIETSYLDSSSYISTENMLPNKAGITLSSGIPSGNAVKFKNDDILISNIRPYFKKIWKADKVGGCSADVICLRASEKVEPLYLYFLLSQDLFFDYVMQGSKGTKMPRGDKNQIMQWPVSIPNKNLQNKIASILSSLDDKIAVNKKICENLEAQAQALFKHWFVDFAPFKDGNFCANREQNETCFNSAEVQPKITGKACKFVESELGLIPLSLVCEQITDGVHNSVKDEPNSSYMLLSCKNIVGGVLSKNNYRSISKNTFDSLRLRTKLAKGDILISSVGTIGEIAIVEEDPLNYEFQRSVAIVKPKEKIGTYFLYNALLASKTRLQHAAHGAVQQCLFLGDLKKFKVNCYDIEKAFLYNETVKPLFEEIAKLHQESDRLATLRDTLLPKLMSGQIKLNEYE